jgi:hypothetical protein
MVGAARALVRHVRASELASRVELSTQGSYSDVGITALMPTFRLCRLDAWPRVFCLL